VILLIDNYDSFTFNVYQQMAAAGATVEVVRNDAWTVEDVLERAPAGVVLSPGPGRPETAGICLELLARLPDETPLLGVCLGHQALCLHYGGRLEIDPIPTHGKPSPVHYAEGDAGAIFRDLPNPFEAGRYHSLRAERASLPAPLELAAWTSDGLVMAVRHRTLPRYGVQFHPESILTPDGHKILARFLAHCGVAIAPTEAPDAAS